MEIFSVPFQQGERRSNVIHVKKNQKENEKKKTKGRKGQRWISKVLCEIIELSSIIIIVIIDIYKLSCLIESVKEK